MSKTQSSSKPRTKKDLIGEDGMKAVFDAYQHETLSKFKATVIDMIESSAAKREVKNRFIFTIQFEEDSKDRVLKIATDFFLAGQGYGV